MAVVVPQVLNFGAMAAMMCHSCMSSSRERDAEQLNAGDPLLPIIVHAVEWGLAASSQASSQSPMHLALVHASLSMWLGALEDCLRGSGPTCSEIMRWPRLPPQLLQLALASSAAHLPACDIWLHRGDYGRQDRSLCFLEHEMALRMCASPCAVLSLECAIVVAPLVRGNTSALAAVDVAGALEAFMQLSSNGGGATTIMRLAESSGRALLVLLLAAASWPVRRVLPPAGVALGPRQPTTPGA